MSIADAPDASRLSKAVTGWQPVDPEAIYRNGDQLLLARAAVSRLVSGGWLYEYWAVTVSCDEHYFELVTADGEKTDLELDECDFVVRLDDDTQQNEGET